MNWYPTVYLSSSRSRRSNFLLEQRCVYGRDLWSSLRLHTRDVNVSTPNRCVIQGILEPFKVRVISKGEALPYYSCKPLQKALHGALRDLDPFRLIGRPLSPTDFIDLKKKSTREDNWFSIDYSAATDGLSWLYSGQIFQRVISKLPFEEQMMAMKVLGPHDLYYPVRPEGEKDFDVSHPVFKGTQTNGQLMGSVLSFPILCLANLGVYLLVTESVQKGWTDRERLAHVLVNGDDMVYAAHPDLWSRHVEVAGKVGLEMSVGKAYVHPVYANVNSTSVHYDLRKEGGTPWQIDYLNAGLFYGQHKVQEAGSHRISLLLGDEERAPNSRWENTGIREKTLRRMLKESDVDISKEGTSLTSTINWILQGSLPGRQKNLLSQFLTLHKEELRQEQAALVKKNGKDYVFSRNLFLPESLGGMGVVPPAGFNFQLKPIQKKVALSMIRKNLIPSTSQLPLPGFPVEKLDLMVNVPWSRTVAVREVFTTTSLDSLPSKMLRAFGNLLYGSCRSTFRI
uniref:RNA-dependent RNA polymerase n=1 Tax=Hubei narna-like virus 8 TaxID=1922961 RepID=A0A1L3KIM4_9VIRU|nr:RNA-dependent RNA polymerase [Hubei narna-like virus 8]